MRDIPLDPVPNQEISVRLDDSRFVLRFKECAGVMVADIIRDDIEIVRGTRVLAGEPIIPYVYQQAGQFLLLTDGGALPDFRLFGTTQQLVYITVDEMAEIRAG